MLSRPAFNQALNFARYKIPFMSAQAVLSDTRWKQIPTSASNTLPYEVFTQPIEQSPQDERSYKLIRLPNRLQALLVHDKDADNSAASMDIAVGHLHDPVSGSPWAMVPTDLFTG